MPNFASMNQLYRTTHSKIYMACKLQSLDPEDVSASKNSLKI